MFVAIGALENTMESFAVMVARAFSNEVFAKQRFIRASVSIFFNFSILDFKEEIYAFAADKGNCVIDKARRNWCAHCRLKRCLRMQMNVNGKRIFNMEIICKLISLTKCVKYHEEFTF